MNDQEFKEKARRHIFNSELREFPVAFEMYVRSFELMIDIEVSMGEILSIIRASQDSATAYVMVCHYLDSLEIPKLEGPTE